MKITNRKLVSLACSLEGGKVQVDAAEGAEFVRWLRAFMTALPPHEVIDWFTRAPDADVAKASAVIAARKRRAAR